jgi:hypothetical protein
MNLVTMVITVPPDELAKTSVDEFFRQMVLGAAITSGGKITAEKKIALGTYEGREVQLLVQPQQGSAVPVYFRAYLVGNNCIVLQGPGAGQSPTPELTAFFNSLKIGG